MFYIAGIMNVCKTVAANVRLPHSLKTKATQVAKANGLSLSDVMRMSLMSELIAVEAGEFRLRWAVYGEQGAASAAGMVGKGPTTRGRYEGQGGRG